MKKIIEKPHIFFFILIPVVIVLGQFNQEQFIAMDISFVQNNIYYDKITYFFALFFGLVGLNYFSIYWGNKKPNTWMTVLHILFQVLALLLFFTKDHWNWLHSLAPSTEQYVTIDNTNTMLILSLLLFMFAAFIHLINFFVTLISKPK